MPPPAPNFSHLVDRPLDPCTRDVETNTRIVNFLLRPDCIVKKDSTIVTRSGRKAMIRRRNFRVGVRGGLPSSLRSGSFCAYCDHPEVPALSLSLSLPLK